VWGANLQSRVDKGLSLKAAVMGETFHALWFPHWILCRQSQPSAQPQALHYHTTTMLHIKQSQQKLKKKCSWPKQTPLLPERITQMQSVVAHRRGWKHHTQSKGWSCIQTLNCEICKLRTWLISADNVILFAPNWAPFTAAAMVTWTESRQAIGTSLYQGPDLLVGSKKQW